MYRLNRLEETTSGQPLVTPSGVNMSNVAAAPTNQHWMRLSLAINLHGTQCLKDVMENEFDCIKDKKDFHLLLTTAHRESNKKNKNKNSKKNKNLQQSSTVEQSKKCDMQDYIWESILGECVGGCSSTCNGETDIDKLDITSLRSIYSNLERIIPSSVMSEKDILDLKERFKKHINSIKENRNKLAHYSLTMSMPTTDFEVQWYSIRNALHGAGYTNLKDFDELKTCSLDPLLKEQMEVIKDEVENLKKEISEKTALERIIPFIDEKLHEWRNLSVFTKLSEMKGISSLINFFNFC